MDKNFMDFMNEIIGNKIQKTNDQRVRMSLLITNLMLHSSTPIELKSTMAASLMDMLETSMIEEDTPLIKLFNDAIDSVCEEAREKYGVDRLRDSLNSIRKQTRETVERVAKGDEILKSLNLDNLNLN